ncbi:MAG: hypothetical protein AAF593_06750, partial [Planctomycetota bacterium]
IPWRVGGPGLWEIQVRRSIAYERGLELTDEELLQMPLTPDQEVRLQERLDWSSANRKLRGLVSTVGLLQYPLVLLNTVGCVVLLVFGHNFRQRLMSLVLILVTAGCGVLMVYREYWSSLGP